MAEKESNWIDYLVYAFVLVLLVVIYIGVMTATTPAGLGAPKPTTTAPVANTVSSSTGNATHTANATKATTTNTTKTTTTNSVAPSTTQKNATSSAAPVNPATTTPKLNLALGQIYVQTGYYVNDTPYQYTYTAALGGKNIASTAGVFQYPLDFYNNYTGLGALPYTIYSIGMNTSGFAVTGTTPELPYTLTPGSSVVVNVTVQGPEVAYAGNLSFTTMESMPMAKTAPADWFEQAGMAFAKNTTGLNYTINAVPQTDANGCGAAYMLNGYSNDGYIYRVGLVYNMCNATGMYPGWRAIFQYPGPGTSESYPLNLASNIVTTSFLEPQVNANDKVALHMYLTTNKNNTQIVYLQVKDLNTGASSTKKTLDLGTASYFVGIPADQGAMFGQDASNFSFTGVVTEWNHINAYTGPEAQVTFMPTGTTPCLKAAAWEWSQEFYNASRYTPDKGRVLFSVVSTSMVLPGQSSQVGSTVAPVAYSATGNFVN